MLPPITIIEGIALDFLKHFHVLFGEYLITYKSTTNTMAAQTATGLALGPSGNLQGGIRVYSLLTGKILHGMINDVTIMKMPQEAIRRLRYRTRKEQSMTGLVFGNRNNEEEEDTTDTRIAGVDGDNDADIDTFTNKPTELETLAIEDDDNLSLIHI